MDMSLPEFLAHAIALEHEAAERYLELADMMESYRNDEVAATFRDMVRYSRLHHESIVARAQGLELPALRSWQYRWRHPPEVGGEEAFDPALSTYEALRYARENEFRAQSFYAQAAQAAGDAEVRRLATEFAAEEAEHVQALDDWLARTPRPSVPWRTDPQHDA
ncbi:MAG TPA: ferritin family protein [Rubrivivax sp.]|nr:ferritin family protein [Rubrivivax sp.]HRZ58977.1 ferritin family protein [Rubrivivax sp.]